MSVYAPLVQVTASHLIVQLGRKSGSKLYAFIYGIMMEREEKNIHTRYKGKGIWNDCNSSRKISLLTVPGKVYGRVLNERMMKITEGSIGTEEGGFRRGRGCVSDFCTVNDS